ncbi:M1 family aminopeptidase [Haliea sp. E1-2-M8]|uniref:M1 family metallopeptidase n=1 Tax=Haliea sp. E1-2-M8 TaxID=3064706 RepID=UPI00271EC5D5|nr:M1 family aminopeptidase [Haliea sp. E1-2-M8]MDO8860591.1 M1 family aminopeptidase [Haliea sp. E1-2-M8]
MREWLGLLCRVWFTVLSGVLLGLLGACGRVDGIPVEPGVSLALAEERAARLSGLHYRLFFAVPAEQSQPIRGEAEIRFTLADAATPLQLDFRAGPGAVQKLVINGSALAAVPEREHILLPAASLRAGSNTVAIAFVAGDSALNRNPDYLYTLFVPDRARTAFPLFDQPDLKATWELNLKLPAGWQALTNGPLLAAEPGAEATLHRFAVTEPISSYLFSFVAGRFQVEQQPWGERSMTLLHRETDPAKLARNLDAIFAQHRAAVAWLEDYTGIAYPFAKLDFALIPAFQYGGMEHVGAIQYRAELLLLDENPTDEELLGRASLIAHEVAHMWFGNLVTMRWFNDVWTKEVFANFMAAKMVNPGFPDIDHELNFLLRHYPAAYAVDRSEGANPIRQQLGNLNEAGQMYGPIIYNKAPIMMRQLERMLGEELFRRGMRDYLTRYAYGNATWPALVEILDPLTEVDLQKWSEVWVHDSGFPGRSLQVEDPELFYGPRPARLAELDGWADLALVDRGRLLLDLYEGVLIGADINAEAYGDALLGIVAGETNQLLLATALSQLSRLQQTLLPDAVRERLQPRLEATLWAGIAASDEPGRTRLLYDNLSLLAAQPDSLQRLLAIWRGEESVPGLQLSENDRIQLAERLALRLPEQSAAIVSAQLAQTENPDSRRRLAFLTPALASDTAVRDRFFAGLADPANRATENWVLDALGYLHHPSRTAHSVRYIQPSLELLQEIQVTGDIFFPSGWLHATLENHDSAEAVATVRAFLAKRPDYNGQLRMKILQALDLPLRAQRLAQ